MVVFVIVSREAASQTSCSYWIEIHRAFSAGFKPLKNFKHQQATVSLIKTKSCMQLLQALQLKQLFYIVFSVFTGCGHYISSMHTKSSPVSHSYKNYFYGFLDSDKGSISEVIILVTWLCNTCSSYLLWFHSHVKIIKILDK